jgi:hypothetical protein
MQVPPVFPTELMAVNYRSRASELRMDYNLELLRLRAKTNRLACSMIIIYFVNLSIIHRFY